MRLLPVIYITITVMFSALFSSFLHAATSHQSFSYIRENVEGGITQQLNGQNLSIFIDQNKLLKIMSELQRIGFIDSNLSRTEIRFYQPLLAATVSVSYLKNLLNKMYSDSPNLDQLHVDAYLLTPNPYGNNHDKTFCYSFDFNRKIYEEINWQRFKAINLTKISPHFITSDLCQQLIEINPMSI